MTQRFTGKTVLITGAAGGMGEAFARMFAQECATLILTDIDEAGLKRTATTVGGTPCSTHRLDLTSEPEIRQFGLDLARQHDRLDVLVNNAGIAYGEIAHGFEKLSQEKWLRFLNVNTVAPLLLAQAVRPLLAAARGTVINITSMAGYAPGTAYGVTKAALNAMTFGMANAFAADQIRVNAIAPGVMETPASRANLPPGTYERIQGMQLIKLDGSADDIARLGLFLASEDGRFINNEIVNCDAGNRIRGWRG